MTTSRVAIIMSVIDRDREDYLRLAIESILQQTYAEVDLHIQLSGPFRPERMAVIEEYAREHPNVFLHPHAENRPLAVCLNDLVTVCRDRYAYLARMDADDVSLPDRVARQVAFMNARPDVDISGGAIDEIDAEGRFLSTVKYPLEHDAMRRFFRKRNPIAHVTVMFRPSYFDKGGLYPPRTLEDGLYWMQGFAGNCRFANLPDVLVQVRRTDDFLKRRSGFATNLAELRIRWQINRRLGFGPVAYGYGLGMFAVQMMPLPVKRLLYEKLR